MKKKVLLICFVSLLTMSVQASDNTQNSALSILNAFMKANSTNVDSSNVQNQIEAFNKNLNESSLKLQNAVQMIARTMTTDTQAELLTKQLNEINNNIKLTEAEKEALLTEVYKEFANSLKENQNVLSKELESYSSKQQTEIINALNSLTNATVDYTNSSKDLTTIIKEVLANPTLTTSLTNDLKELKNTGTALKSNLQSIKTITTNSYKLCKQSGIIAK